MKNRYLQLTLQVLFCAVLLAGCAQIKTAEQKPLPVVSPQLPQELPEQQPLLKTEPQPQSATPEVVKEIVPPAPVEEKPFIHEVRWSGETLNRISWWYTGSGRNWPAIVEANPGLDPRQIMVGNLIVIPRQLLQRQDPMTRDYRTPSTVSRELEIIAPATEVPAPQTVDLFGPIDSVEQISGSANIETNLPLESLE